ncbi:MAG: nucleotide exchange factor GrpE [Spirochaetota bacterium]|nr:MAG: nucleotide exchange factor GrpE [Spirochaetota bacterium]
MDNIDNTEYKEESTQKEELNREEPEAGLTEETPKGKKTKEKPTKKDELKPMPPGKAKVSEKKGKNLKEQLIDALDEEEINDLLSAKQELKATSQKLEEKSTLLLEYEDLLKRKQAEFENYQKRVKREFEDVKKYATAELVLDILNTIDNFERAIESTKSSKDFDALRDGIVIIENQMKSVLEKNYGVIVIDDVGKEFDPNIHDAIMMEESGEYEEDTIIENLQKGYRMHDRILRPAKVKVAKAVSPFNDTDDKTHDDEGQPSEKGE